MAIPSKSSALLWIILAGMAVFTPRTTVRAGDAPRKEATDRLDAPALTRFIDKSIQQRLLAEKVTASPLADDAEFLRRVYLDITGVIPPADKVILFLDSKQPDKRALLIDELLANPNY